MTLRVLGWRKNKKANKVAATEPLEVVLPTKGIDLNSVIAIDDSGFFDVEAEFRDDGGIEDSVSCRVSNDFCHGVQRLTYLTVIGTARTIHNQVGIYHPPIEFCT